MVATLNSGPYISAGNLIDALGNGTPQITNPSPGPNMDYHGDSFLDVRYFPIAKDMTDRHGVIPAFFVTQQTLTINAIPQAKAAANIAALAHVVTGTPMTLAAASTGIAKNIPIDPFGSTPVTTAALALDFGFELTNISSGSKNVTVADSSKYFVGMPLIFGEGATTTTPLITYVTGITSATVITIANAAGRSNSASPTGTGNSWGNLDSLPNSISTFAQPYIAGGPGLFFDPTQGISRCVSITGVSAGAGGTFIVAGWDIYGQAQTDLITVAAGINTVNSLKAFKYIASVTPQFTDPQNYSVGTADIIGLPLRSDLFEQTLIYDAGALLTANTGYVKADATSPATNATGDPRGTYALQTAADGTRRTVIYQFPSFQQLARSAPVSYSPLYGVTPV